MKIPNLFLSILTLLFITLKLTGLITWSWWWVLSPIIFQGILITALIFMFGLFALIIFATFNERQLLNLQDKLTQISYLLTKDK
jgi:hypothetical protein